jgi:hypothetical protein
MTAQPGEPKNGEKSIGWYTEVTIELVSDRPAQGSPQVKEGPLWNVG